MVNHLTIAPNVINQILIFQISQNASIKEQRKIKVVQFFIEQGYVFDSKMLPYISFSVFSEREFIFS
jgi:hypothetical protein